MKIIRKRGTWKRQVVAGLLVAGVVGLPTHPAGATFRGEVAVGGSLMHRFDTDTPIALGVGFSFAGKKNNAFRAGVAGEF